MRRLRLLAVLLGVTLAVPAITHAQIVAKITLSSQRMLVYVALHLAGLDRVARLPHPDRQVQADRAGAVPPLDHL
jgi:hypothetical protein